MIANSDKTHRVADSRGKCGQRFLDVFDGDVPHGVCGGQPKRDDLSAARMTPPVEQPRRQFFFRFARTHHHIILLPRRCHVIGKSRGMSKRIDVESDFGKESKTRSEIVAAELDLLLERKAAGKVAVGLNPPASDDFPPAFLNKFFDARKQLRFHAFNGAINPGLATRKDQVGMTLQKIAGRATSAEQFIESRLPGPEPDRIDVSVEDKMDGFHEREGFETLP